MGYDYQSIVLPQRTILLFIYNSHLTNKTAILSVLNTKQYSISGFTKVAYDEKNCNIYKKSILLYV
jgi:hypothetical protein